LIPEEFLEERRHERTTLPTIKKSLKGKVIIQDEEQALGEPKNDIEGLVLWTDGLRKKDEWAGCAVVWREERWKKRRVYLGRQKEAFDAEMYAMSEAVKIADEICRKQGARRVMIFTNSQVILRRIQLEKPEPG